MIGNQAFEIQPFDLADGIQVRISASIGAAIHPRHGQDPDALVAHADEVLTKAFGVRYQQTLPTITPGDANAGLVFSLTFP